MFLLFPSGGLGNQMFMIASVYAFAKSSNQTFYVDYSEHTLIQGQQITTYLSNLFHQIPLYTPERKAIVEYRLKCNPPTLHKEIFVDYFKHTMFETDIEDSNKLFVCLDSNFTSVGYFHNYRSQLLQLFNIPSSQQDLVEELATQYLKDWPITKSSHFQELWLKYSLAPTALSHSQLDTKIAQVQQDIARVKQHDLIYNQIKESYEQKYPTPESRVLKRRLSKEEMASIDGTVDIHAPLPEDFPHFFFNHLTRQHQLNLQEFQSLQDQLEQLQALKQQPQPSHFPTIEQRQLLKQLRESKEVINLSVHVRRGDYLQLQEVYQVLDAQYYQKAFAQFQGIPKHMVVFSDDIEWAQTTLPNLIQETHTSWSFVSNEIPDYLALLLMARCDHHIIANSTFSWWGQYLNPNPNRIVVAPKRYFSKNEDQERVALLQLPQFVLID